MGYDMDAITLSSDEFHLLFANVTPDEVPFYYYPQPMNVYRIALITFYCLLFAIGAIGNLWVACIIGVVLHQTTVGSASNSSDTPRTVQIYILSLCICDLLVITLLIFLISDLIYGQWMFPSSTFLCRLYWSGEFLTKFAGPVLLTGLAGYCYACICLNAPIELEPQNRKCSRASLAAKKLFNWCGGGDSGKRALIFILVGVAFIFSLVAPIYMYSEIQYVILHNSALVYAVAPKCALPQSQTVTIFTVCGFILGYVIPSTCFTFFYVSILLHVRRHSRKWRATGERSLYFWRVAKVTGGLVTFYLGCWTPYWAMNLIKYFTAHSESANDETSTVSSVVLSYFIHMLPYINCTGYPIIYTILNRNIKAAYGRVMALRKRRRSRNGHLTDNNDCKLCGFNCRQYGVDHSSCSHAVLSSDTVTSLGASNRPVELSYQNYDSSVAL